MPKRCYGRGTTNHPVTQKIDFEVAWNLDVLNKRNVEDTEVTDEATTDALLCNTNNLGAVPASTPFNLVSPSTIISYVGFTM